jgi:hypothetical protein
MRFRNALAAAMNTMSAMRLRWNVFLTFFYDAFC